MEQTKVVTSAIIVSPPENTWGPIQEIRLKHDKAYRRWMPHINLIYPFYPEEQFSSVLPQLREALSSVSPFEVVFDSFDVFLHGSTSYTMFLHPTTTPPSALSDLQAKLQHVFPQCSEQSTKSQDGFHAHLTVGQFRGKSLMERKKADLSRNWKPIVWRVDHVQLISRTASTPFKVIHTVPLGGAGSSPSATVQKQTAPAPTREPRKPPRRQPTGSKEIPQPGQAEAIVIERLKQWIRCNTERPKSSLPKTKPKLRSAIKPMCSVKTEYMKVDDVMKQLEDEGYYRVVKDDRIAFLKKKAKEESDRLSTNSFVSRESYRLANQAHKEPAEIVMARCREWVEAPLNTPTTRVALRTSLKQLCVMNEEVDRDRAVQLLEAHNVIAIDHDDKVAYP